MNMLTQKKNPQKTDVIITDNIFFSFFVRTKVSFTKYKIKNMYLKKFDSIKLLFHSAKSGPENIYSMWLNISLPDISIGRLMFSHIL